MNDDVNDTRQFASWIFEWIAITLAITALFSPLVLGGGHSKVAQGVFLALAGGSLVPSILAMALAGRFRVVRSFLWGPILLLPAIGAAQWFAFGTTPPTTPKWRLDSSLQSISVDRAATVGATAWLFGAAMLFFVISSHVRTLGRLSAVAVAAVVFLALLGMAGWTQSAIETPPWTTWADDTNGPISNTVCAIEFGRPSTSLGYYMAWTVDPSIATAAIFLPPSTRYLGFGESDWGYAWSSAIAMILPLAIAVVVYLARRGRPVGGLRAHAQSNSALLLWLTILSMAATAIWFVDPYVLPTLTLSTCLLIPLCIGREHRAVALGFCGATSIVVGGVAAARWTIASPGDLNTRIDNWCTNTQAAFAIIRDHPWLGCGLGCAPNLWPLYQSSADSLREASSVLVLATEVGFVGLVAIGMTVVYLLLRPVMALRRLDTAGKLALTGTLLACWNMLLLAVAGQNLSTAMTLALGVLLVACLARALAGGFDDQEAQTT